MKMGPGPWMARIDFQQGLKEAHFHLALLGTGSFDREAHL